MNMFMFCEKHVVLNTIPINVMIVWMKRLFTLYTSSSSKTIFDELFLIDSQVNGGMTWLIFSPIFSFFFFKPLSCLGL